MQKKNILNSVKKIPNNKKKSKKKEKRKKSYLPDLSDWIYTYYVVV